MEDAGWNSRIQTSDIPLYNSLADRYNPFTHTKKFAKRFAAQKRLEEKERREKLLKRQNKINVSQKVFILCYPSSVMFFFCSTVSVTLICEKTQPPFPELSQQLGPTSTNKGFSQSHVVRHKECELAN